MVDPAKIHAFLTRTLASLEQAKQSGDAEATLRLEPLMDRGNALAAKAISQQEQMRQAPAPQVPQQQAVQSLPQDPRKQPGSPEWNQTSANTKAATAAMGNPEPFNQTEGAQPLGGNSEFDNIMRSLQQANAPLAPRQPSVNRHHDGSPPQRNMRSEEVAPTLEYLSQPPAKAVKSNDEVARLSDWLKQEPPEKKVDPKLMDGGLGGAEAGFSKVAPEEEDAVARIRKMVGEKPSAFTLENLAMLFLFGAPRTFAKIQADSKNWEETLRQLVAQDSKDKKEEKRHKESLGFREREVSANEKRAQTDQDKARAGVQGSDLRAMVSAAKGIVNAPSADPGSQEYKDAVRFLSAVRPPQAQDGVPGVPK